MWWACAIAPLSASWSTAFARVSAVVGLKVEDYFPLKKRWWLRLHEKNGKVNAMGCHHKLEQFLDEYIAAAGITGDKKARCFAPPSAGRASSPTGPFRASMPGTWLRRRAKDAGVEAAIGNHSFRAIGITDYLDRGG